jgi:hypothetical protein
MLLYCPFVHFLSSISFAKYGYLIFLWTYWLADCTSTKESAWFWMAPACNWCSWAFSKYHPGILQPPCGESVHVPCDVYVFLC